MVASVPAVRELADGVVAVPALTLYVADVATVLALDTAAPGSFTVSVMLVSPDGSEAALWIAEDERAVDTPANRTTHSVEMKYRSGF